LHDATVVMQHPPQQMLDLWKEFMRTEWSDTIKMIESFLPHAAVRVIPINTTAEPNSQVLAMDDVSKLIEGARTIAVTKCSCRVIDGACGKPLEVCMQLDRAAEYSIERGTGRPLTREQALRMLEQCEEEGLVHVAENKQGVGNVICNCCNDCCLNWTSIRSGLGKFVAPSRFRAAIQAEDCNGCELCVDRCFFDAMHMVEADTLAAVDQDKCMGCGVCRVVCPTDAISMELVRPQDFIPA
jgi:Pyruvate/2-oxoacid:ferredoxin oxidoreductase delta subunit